MHQKTDSATKRMEGAFRAKGASKRVNNAKKKKTKQRKKKKTQGPSGGERAKGVLWKKLGVRNYLKRKKLADLQSVPSKEDAFRQSSGAGPYREKVLPN